MLLQFVQFWCHRNGQNPPEVEFAARSVAINLLWKGGPLLAILSSHTVKP
jgi:hypothetical protein